MDDWIPFGPLLFLWFSLLASIEAPPPRFQVPLRALYGVLVLAGGMVGSGVGLLLWGSLDWFTLLASSGAGIALLYCWLAVAHRSDDSGDNGSSGPGPNPNDDPPSGPIDWCDFDRARAAWRRERERV